VSVRSSLQTYAALGISNVLKVASYRARLRAGIHPAQRLPTTDAKAPFFSCNSIAPRKTLTPRKAWTDRQGEFFGLALPLQASPPHWHSSCQDPSKIWDEQRPWWQIGDFETGLGDIKAVWEASRFDWVIPMAQRAATGDLSEMRRLNDWLTDWIAHNRPFLGVNWKCGQESSIRLIRLIIALLILGEENQSLQGLRDLVRMHLIRIAPTIGYAIGQANNHGTSEAAALFIGGSLLGRESKGGEAERWLQTGRSALENRATTLIERDGTFSQYSVTYHRLMLETYCLVEVWRRRFALPRFSDQLHERLRAAVHWLRQMTDPYSGDAANIGANDGAQLLALTDNGYRDFRPLLQLAAALFEGACERSGDHDQYLAWLGVEKPTAALPPLSSETFDDGGFHVLRNDRATAILRYPRFRFRPGHADALHVDFWLDGQNVLRDAGTYSYSVPDEVSARFAGAAGHNTIQFDDHDQMPRLGRFLFSDWLKSHAVQTIEQDADGVSAAAGYRDAWGASHVRHVRLEAAGLIVSDDVSEFQRSATMRFRLMPGEWVLNGQSAMLGDIKITIESTVPLQRIALTVGEESRYYLKTSPVPVLEVQVNQPGQIRTTIRY